MRFALLLLALIALPAHATSWDDGEFISVNGEKVFVRHKKAAAGAPTLVLLNGLTYSTAQWGAFASAIERLEPGFGIVKYDMRGMGKTLLEGNLPVNYSISLDSQVEQLKGLLPKLGLKKVDLVGLSYGGGVAIAFANAYPKLVRRIFLMAPFTEALEDQDRIIRAQIAGTRLTFPFNPATDDELYDYFLRQFIYTTYPSSEPVVLENPFKLEAIFRMVQGIRLFKATEATGNLPADSVHLIIANQDQYIPKKVMDRFWSALPKGVRSSRIDISYSEHKLPESIPNYTAAWITTVIKDGLRGEYQGTSWAYRAQSESKVVELPRP
jgi:pimeloyl-ACP methyl ester carboxylesterase